MRMRFVIILTGRSDDFSAAGIQFTTTDCKKAGPYEKNGESAFFLSFAMDVYGIIKSVLKK